MRSRKGNVAAESAGPGRRWSAAVATMIALGGTAFAANRPESLVQDSPTPTKTEVVHTQAKPATKGEPGRSIAFRGKVVDPAGRPVAGAKVFLLGQAIADANVRSVSGADGTYRFAVPEADLQSAVQVGGPRPQIYASVVVAGGFGLEWARLTGDEAGRPPIKTEYMHDFRLSKDRPIVGRIIDTDERPVAGASVAVQNLCAPPEGRWDLIMADLRELDVTPLTQRNAWSSFYAPAMSAVIPPAKTDHDGRFRIDGVGRDRMADLYVSGPAIAVLGFTVLTGDDVDGVTNSLRAEFPPIANDDENPKPARPGMNRNNGNLYFGPNPELRIDRARTVAGVVRAADTGVPLAGVLARVVDQNIWSQWATTDAAGHYRCLHQGGKSTAYLSIFTNYQNQGGVYLDALRKLEGLSGPGESIVDFKLTRGVVVTGRVLEANSDRPIISSPPTHPQPHPQPAAPRRVKGQFQAGWISYRPLATNAALRDTPTGAVFEAHPETGLNQETMAQVADDGTFRVLVPPGPGVLLVTAMPSGAMMTGGWYPWQEDQGHHRLFPYATIGARSADDGAPPSADGDRCKLDGFGGPIPLAGYVAYRVINPAADARALTVDLAASRGATRVVRFVDPEGKPASGLAVRGVTAPPNPVLALKGPEIEVIGLDATHPREILAVSDDGRLFARASVLPDPTGPLTVRLEPAPSISARLVNAYGRSLSNHAIGLSYRETAEPWAKLAAQQGMERVPRPASLATVTDVDGKFRLVGLIPGIPFSITFQEQNDGNATRIRFYRPEPLAEVTLRPGEDRDVGEITVTPVSQ